MKHQTSIEMTKFLSAVAQKLGVAEHTYVVGGAPRNWLIKQPVKDLDVVIDSIALEGKDSAWFAEHLRKAIPTNTSLVTNQYGVAIITVSGEWLVGGENLRGEVIEIANARRESYESTPTSKGKGYKPHLVEPTDIRTDLLRRDFTLNTLLWRLADLTNGPDHAEVLDMLGTGRKHLEERILQTPMDADKTFSDDPTRCLRVIKFVAKYNFRVPPALAEAIRRNAPKLAQMPSNAVQQILINDILDAPNPRRSIVMMQELGLADVLKQMLHTDQGMAAALGRSLNEHEAHVLLDLLDLGWAMKTPISFLSREQQLRLREILLQFASSPDFDKNFVGELIKPHVNQQRLFAEYAIPPKERGVVVQIARELLLRDPLLNEHPNAHEGEVEEEIAKRYPRVEPSLSERVVARFTQES